MKLSTLISHVPDPVYVRIYANDEPIYFGNDVCPITDPELRKSNVISVSPILLGMDYNLTLCLRVDIDTTLTKLSTVSGDG